MTEIDYRNAKEKLDKELYHELSLLVDNGTAQAICYLKEGIYLYLDQHFTLQTLLLNSFIKDESCE